MADLVMDIYLRAHNEFEDIFKKLGVEVDGLRGKIGLVSGAFGVLAAGVLAESVKQAADWQTTISEVAANTNMTTQQMNEMSAAIKSIASESSAPMEDLARGYEHIGNFGYRGADATNILRAAQESAVSTGSNTAEVANMLASVMKEYGLATNRAADAINVMHTASAMGNMRLGEFVEYGGRAIGMAAGLGISLTQVSAAMAALTQHGLDAPRAGAYLAGMMNSIVSPTSQAREALKHLSQVTGVDLVYDFSSAGLKAKGLAGVLADVQKATHGNKELISQLIPGLEAGYAAFMLTTQGAADYHRILGALNDTMSGKTNPTAEAYARTQQTVAFQVGVLKNNLQLMAISIGEAVLPALNRLLGAVVPVVRAIADWTSKHSGLVAGLLAGVAVVGTLIGAILVLGPVIAAIASPIGIVVVAIGAAVAGIVALISSSQSVRDILAGVWSAIEDAAGALWQGLTGIWNGIRGDAMLLWEDLGSWLSDTWRGIVSFAGPIWNGLVNSFKYVWDRITGDKDGAANALRAIPTEWRPLVQAIGDVLAGSWFTVKYLWDDLTGNHKAATADLKNIPPEWRPLVQDIAATLAGSGMTVKYLWDTITGDHKKATNDLKRIPKEWRPLVKDIGNVFEGLGRTAQRAWHDLGDTAKNAWEHTLKPMLKSLRADWDRFAKEAGPELGPALRTVGTMLSAAFAPVKAAFEIVVSGLKGAWTGFWQHGAKQLVLDGLHMVGTVIRASVRSLEDAILVVLGVLSGRWDKAWKAMKDLVGTMLGAIAAIIKGSVKMMEDAAGAVVNAILGLFGGMVKEALHIGENIIKNLAKGVGHNAHELYTAVRNALGPIGKLFPASPAEEGPLSIPPDFTYIAAAMHAAIPHVRAAGMQLMGAAGVSGGSLGLDVGTSGALGSAGGATSTFNAGHTVTIAPTINISGGTFTDKQGVRDLAKAVSDEIMHSVRMQGGLLPQM